MIDQELFIRKKSFMPVQGNSLIQGAWNTRLGRTFSLVPKPLISFPETGCAR